MNVDLCDCGEICYYDCQGAPRCPDCDEPCPCCDDGGGPDAEDVEGD